MIILHYLTAAFDTVEHSTLLQRLELSYGIGASAISWFNGRTEFVRCQPCSCVCGSPLHGLSAAVDQVARHTSTLVC